MKIDELKKYKLIIFDFFGVLYLGSEVESGEVKYILNDELVNIIKTLSVDHTLAVGSSSSKTTILSALRQYSIQDNFKLVLGIEDVKKPKPDPEVYLKIIENLNIKPEDAVVIEDTETGALAAKSAGIHVIMV